MKDDNPYRAPPENFRSKPVVLTSSWLLVLKNYVWPAVCLAGCIFISAIGMTAAMMALVIEADGTRLPKLLMWPAYIAALPYILMMYTLAMLPVPTNIGIPLAFMTSVILYGVVLWIVIFRGWAICMSVIGKKTAA